MTHFQYKVATWMQACFGPVISADKQERNDRFLEESLELVQAGGMSKQSALALVDYTFGRPVGDLRQEVGGVMVTLAALCQANCADMDVEGSIELDRIDTPEMIEKIRAKQKSKPRGSPLPQATSIDGLARQLTQNQSDNLDGYILAYLKATGLGIEDVTLSQQTFIENGMAGTRYWCERKVPADSRIAWLNPAFAAPYGASDQTPPAAPDKDDGPPVLGIDRLLARLERAAADPMLADHAEVSKVTLRAAAKVVRDYSNLKFAFDEWLTKTEWVQEQKATFPFNILGMHRADIMRRAIDEMRKLVAVPRTDQEIVDQTNELASELAGLAGYIVDGKLYEHPDERAIDYWNMACFAQEKLTATDPNDALSNLEQK